MRGNPSITTGEIASILDINRSVVMRQINVLMQDGVIARTGAARRGEWIVLKP